MKVIGFNASPRREGNTAWAVRRILAGVQEQGSETRFWSFDDLDIGACRGCLACHQGDGGRGCVIDDGMQVLYEALEDADALVLGSPVYMGQMSAQAKIFTDRLFAQINPRFSPHFKEKNAAKKLILVFTQGNPDSGMFQTYFDYTEHMFQLLEFDVRGVHVITGMRNEPAHARKDLHVTLAQIGSALAADRFPA